MSQILIDATLHPQNKLLAALPSAEWSGLRVSAKPVFMTPGTVLYEPDTPVKHLYFPVTSIISISYGLLDGTTDAMMLVGHDGFVSVPVFLGSGTPRCRAVVEGQGWAHRIEHEAIVRACERGGTIRQMLLRYTQSYITQVSQTTVCNRLHSIDQQLCRWLLIFLDRSVSSELRLTHEHMAGLLGVRRESVTEAARKLQIAGAIHYHRGHISVVQRGILEARTCECYGVAKWEADRLVPFRRPRSIAAASVTRINENSRFGATA